MTFIVILDKTNFAFAGIIFALIHELGHLIAICFLGGKIQSVNFGIANIDIVKSCDISKNEILVLLSGSITNFLFVCLFAGLYNFFGNICLLYFMYQNLAIGIFNLLPIESLDGGRILSIFLSSSFEMNKASRISKIISYAFLVPIVLLGIYVVFESKYNFSLLIVISYLVLEPILCL